MYNTKTIKRFMDIILSIAFLMIFSPLLIMISIVLFCTNKKVIFLHKRIGKNKKEFYCIKFATMVKNSEYLLKSLLLSNTQAQIEWSRTFKLTDDPRITKIGRFLRKTSFDELPQLVNVVIGNMSLVGPRPITRNEIHFYAKDFVFYIQVSPGITGAWQISGVKDYKQRVLIDKEYILNWSLWNDVKILFKTVNVLFKMKNT